MKLEPSRCISPGIEKSVKHWYVTTDFTAKSALKVQKQQLFQ